MDDLQDFGGLVPVDQGIDVSWGPVVGAEQLRLVVAPEKYQID